METRGRFAPSTEEEARERYEAVGPVAQTVVREVAKGMDLDRDEYEERVTADVVARARDALFASELAVTVGTRAEFDDWAETYDGEVTVLGSEHVEHVAWHAAPTGEAVAATFQAQPDAAVDTLRRQAFGRCYRPLLEVD